ncbi:hypothetical protein BC351_00935 [Paenibacillus ferrarius]|uniref:DUF5405 domain-containing protein n=1 Tax=Paenibacillus ferrarius TaxID=1469647 RepID=A0A1V4HSH7_9BACL|nr:hypothetical protein [Paenibacillus ferrarius]OPH61837.1 hypothetical protein BC351_00935 [Paenibacillus ferrarius]
MKVEIEPNLFIESDTHGYQVVKYTGYRFDKKLNRDVETYNVLANFQTVKGCAKWISLSLKVKESTAATLKELVQDVKRIEKYIENKINF